ncbi:MAG: hypothetical protein QXS92_04275 [Thermofilum sp.]
MLRLPSRGIDLELTLKPSFILALFEKEEGSYRKIAGCSLGCRIWQKRGEFFSTCPAEEVEYYTGLWFLEVKAAESPHRRFSQLVDNLIEVYAGLSLAVDIYDPLYIFIAVFLSQNTSYRTNVLRWTRELWRTARDPATAAEAAPGVGGSFQLKRLPEVFRCVAGEWPRDPYQLRRFLVSCKYVGPKTADATLLFARAESSAAPVDRHFLNMVSRLSLFPGAGPPVPAYCKRFPCFDCPKRGSCIRWLASKYFGRLAGWVQTAFYIHDAEMCSRSMCRECALKDFCEVGKPGE